MGPDGRDEANYSAHGRATTRESAAGGIRASLSLIARRRGGRLGAGRVDGAGVGPVLRGFNDRDSLASARRRRVLPKRLVGPRGGAQWKGIINDALGSAVRRPSDDHLDWRGRSAAQTEVRTQGHMRSTTSRPTWAPSSLIDAGAAFRKVPSSSTGSRNTAALFFLTWARRSTPPYCPRATLCYSGPCPCVLGGRTRSSATLGFRSRSVRARARVRRGAAGRCWRTEQRRLRVVGQVRRPSPHARPPPGAQRALRITLAGPEVGRGS